MRTKNLKMSARIGRVQSNMEDDYFEITIEDNVSGIMAIKMKISIAEFANLMSMRSTKGTAVVDMSGNVGKIYEHNTVIVSYDHSFSESSDNLSMLKLFSKVAKENPGWTVRSEPFSSRAYDHKNKTYPVFMYRYVDTE